LFDGRNESKLESSSDTFTDELHIGPSSPIDEHLTEIRLLISRISAVDLQIVR
jgi:hypothetical protein